MKNMKRLWNFSPPCTSDKAIIKNVRKSATFYSKSTPKMTRPDPYSLKSCSKKTSTRKPSSNSKRCSKISLTSTQFWPSLSTFSGETINSQKPKNTLRQRKTRPVTQMMQVYVFAEDCTTSTREILLML